MATVIFTQGSSINRVITIKDEDKNILNITDGTVKFRIVTTDSDVEAEAIFADNDVPVTDGPNGQVTLIIARSVSKLWTPGDYRWEVEYIDSATNFSHTDTDMLIIKNSIYSEDA